MKHKGFLLVFTFLFISLFSRVAFSAVEYVCLNLNYDGKTHQYVEQKVTLKINGKEMQKLTMPPIILNDYTFVPAREVFEEVGAKVEWNKNTYEVKVTYADKMVVLKIGNKNATINGKTTAMSTPAKIINNKTMIPLRFVSTSVGLNVSWDSKTRTASVVGKATSTNNSSSTNSNAVVTNLSEIKSVTTPKSYSEGKFVVNLNKAVSNIKPMFLTENRLVVDVYDAVIKTSSNSIDVSNYAVLRVRFGQNDSVARVVFDLKSELKYNVSLADDKKSIIVDFGNDSSGSSNTTNNSATNNSSSNQTSTNVALGSNAISSGNMSYDNVSTTLSINKNNAVVDLNKAEHIDDYNNGIYKLIFYGDYTNYIGNSTIAINDHNFGNIQLVVNSTSMTVVINEKSILAFEVSQDDKNIYIHAVKPKVKYKNIVVLDAGHGGHDSGAVANGYVEKSINLDIVNRVLALLDKDGTIKGYGTRTTDVYPSFADRNNLGNEVGDLFISVHINSASAEKANGTEVYWYKENLLSRGISSSVLASTLQKNLLAKLGSFDRKVKTENFIVLRQSEVPATLCEIGFITNSQEGAKLNSPEYRQLAAEAIYQSIKELFQKYPSDR